MIIACRLNAPGSWNDAKLARVIFQKIRHQTPDNYFVITDTAFPRGENVIQHKIKAPMKQGKRVHGSPAEIREILAFNSQLTGARQAAEWAMRAMQGGFSRLKLPLSSTDTDGSGDTIEVAVRMCNVRTKRVGINQILNFYVPIWKENEVDAQMWDGFESMLFGDVQRKDRVSKFHSRLQEV
jgi:hypothetical protein